MARTVLLLALFGGAAILAAPPVKAHGIQSTLDYLPSSGFSSGAGAMEVQSSFSTGLPARDAAVRLLPPDGGKAIELGHTGPDGRLTFTLPPTASKDWEIQVDAGPGHRDYLAPTDAGGAPVSPGVGGHAAAPIRHWIGEGALSWPLTGLALVGGIGLLARRRSRS
jgi:nickel transport protein